jgi:hypothetical protein
LFPVAYGVYKIRYELCFDGFAYDIGSLNKPNKMAPLSSCLCVFISIGLNDFESPPVLEFGTSDVEYFARKTEQYLNVDTKTLEYGSYYCRNLTSIPKISVKDSIERSILIY